MLGRRAIHFRKAMSSTHKKWLYFLPVQAWQTWYCKAVACPLGSHWQLTDTSCADLQELANAVYAKLQSWVDQFVYRR